MKASVAGTPQAQEALIANGIPQTAEVAIAGAKLTPPAFDGEPRLAPIETTTLQYVVNSSTPIIMVDAPTITRSRTARGSSRRPSRGRGEWPRRSPRRSSTIPPSSPLHHVTYVRVYYATPTTVYGGYTPGYHGTCVSHGVVVYGTGYRYTPWVHTKFARRANHPLCLLYIDMDCLKQINDTFGHAEGDLALTHFVRILTETFRDTDVIGRMGGDEFVILTIDATEKDIATIQTRLQSNVNAYNLQSVRRYELSFSLGVVQVDLTSTYTVETLLSQADAIMYEQKRLKKGRMPNSNSGS